MHFQRTIPGDASGRVAEWLNAADCKSVPSGYGGSNPSPPTILGEWC